MSYALRLGVTPTQQFHSLDGRPPEAYEVRFRTSSEGLTTTIAEALAQDAGTLPPADTPRP